MTKGMIFVPFLSFLLFIGPGCSDHKGDGSSSCLEGYQTTPLLTAYAEEIIVPTYNDFVIEMDSLNAVSMSFFDNPSISSLAKCRIQLETVYLDWQSVSMFGFGPAEAEMLIEAFNNYPLNATQAMANAKDGITDFSTPGQYNKGLPLLEFLWFGLGSDQETIDSFNNNAHLAVYAKAVLNDMTSKLARVNANWKSYQNTFISANGTSDGQSINVLINAINKHYEEIKRNKIGVPSGVLSLGFTNPTEVEGFYSGWSINLAQSALLASEKFFKGTAFNGQDGEGLEEVLNFVGASKSGEPLANVVLNQYADSRSALSAITGSLRLAVDNDKEQVKNTYTSLSQQVIHLKSDMPSVLCIPITYVDNPSDSD